MNSLILLFVRLVFSCYKYGKFCKFFLQLPTYVLRIYVERCFNPTNLGIGALLRSSAVTSVTC